MLFEELQRVELKLKQASAVLGMPQKGLQHFVQARVLKPRRRLGLYYFDTRLLLQATVALYLKESLGASTRYLAKFADAEARFPRVRSRSSGGVDGRLGQAGYGHGQRLSPKPRQIGTHGYNECAEVGATDFIVTLNTKDFPQSRLPAERVPVPSQRTGCSMCGARGTPANARHARRRGCPPRATTRTFHRPK
jgi:hypothetical protein